MVSDRLRFLVNWKWDSFYSHNGLGLHSFVMLNSSLKRIINVTSSKFQSKILICRKVGMKFGRGQSYDSY